MYILGLNSYHGDSSACLIKDGKLLCAQEEERIRRIKHWAGLPTESIRWCLEYEGITLDKVDYIAVAKDPKAHITDKVLFILKSLPGPSVIFDRIKGLKKSNDLVGSLADEFNIETRIISSKIRRIEHHKAHLASAFFVSPHKDSTIVSVDGMGDFVSAMWGKGEDNIMEIYDYVMYPHSLGFFYTALTQFLGFNHYGDEYKVMGLSAQGDPEKYIDKMREIVLLQDNGKFLLNLKYFEHYKKNVNLNWDNGSPDLGKMFSNELEDLLGPARKEKEEINEKYADIAAATQKMYEEAFFHILNHAYRKTKNKTLCLAGGTAQNSLANGKIYDNTEFEEVYIPPAAHDGGTSVGAAFYLWNEDLDKPRNFIMNHSSFGPEYSNDEIEKALSLEDFEIKKLEKEELIEETAKLLSEGNVIGWFQGRSEWGPRALGNRSILADPRKEEMKDIINKKIKLREPFRPFAPSISEEYLEEYFENDQPAPFMEKVYKIKKEKQKEIPAVTHLDGTGRLQTVNKETHSLYWSLINKFKEITGVSVILNTSFNENEPIVNSPEEAIDCFKRTDMDILVIGNYLVKK